MNRNILYEITCYSLRQIYKDFQNQRDFLYTVEILDLTITRSEKKSLMVEKDFAFTIRMILQLFKTSLLDMKI
jgi:hypothetical protein